MKIIPILFITILMITDYALTVWGARLSKEKYGQHFKTKIYELNPLWQKAIEKPRIINLRHLIFVMVVTGYLLFTNYILPDELEGVISLVFGMITIPYLTIVGRHMTNILIFSYLKSNPSEIEGEVNTSKAFSVKLSQYNILSLTMIFGVIYFYTYSQFILGGVIGCTILYLTHFIWKVRVDKK